MDQYLRTSGPPLGRAVQAESVRITSSLSISGPGVKARPGKFNFGMGTGGYESSGDGIFEAVQSLFRPDVESPSEMSLVGGTRGQKGLTIHNYPNINITDSRDKGPLLEISLPEEGGSGIRGAALAGGSMICMSSMDECNTA